MAAPGGHASGRVRDRRPRTGLYDPEAPDGPHDGEAYAAPDFPAPARRHLANWGEGWLHMAPVIGETVAATGADVLLVSLGLIDLGFYTNSDQTDANVRAFVGPPAPRTRASGRSSSRSSRTSGPPTTPPSPPSAPASTTSREGRGRPGHPGLPLLLGTIPESYALPADTYDGTHPGPSGEHKLAAAFADAMHQAWDLGGPYTPGP